MSDQPRQPKGQPVGGQFAVQQRSEAATALLPAPNRPAHAAAIQAFLDDEWGNEAALDRDADFDDRDEPTWGSALDSLDQMPDDVLDSILDGTEETPELFRAAFAARAQTEGLDTELPRIACRYSSHVVLGADLPQTPAEAYRGDLITDADILFAPAADYAAVGDEGIAYGINDNPGVLLDVVAGPQLPGESYDDWYDRALAADPDFVEHAETFIANTYGGELLTGSGDLAEDRLTVEFWVPFEDGGATASSIEYMGDRVETETKINAYDQDAEIGSRLATGFANHLGMTWDTEAGRWARPLAVA